MTSMTAQDPRVLLDRTVGGLVLVLMHEVHALSGHWAELRERIAVARNARGFGDLLRSQFDLLPETRARLARDRGQRRQLLSGLWSDLSERAAP